MGWEFARRLSFDLGIGQELAEQIREFVDSSPEYWNQEQMREVENTFDKEMEVAEATIERLNYEIDLLIANYIRSL